MASSQTAAVIERLLDDDYVHEQLATAGAGARGAYRRARRLPPQKAVQDKTVYDRVRQTATGLTEAARRAAGKPKPKPPRRRRGLLLLVLMIAAGAVVLWAAKSRSQTQEGTEAPGANAQPEPTPTAAADASPTSTTATDH